MAHIAAYLLACDLFGEEQKNAASELCLLNHELFAVASVTLRLIAMKLRSRTQRRCNRLNLMAICDFESLSDAVVA